MSDEQEKINVEVDPTTRAYNRIGQLTHRVDVQEETIEQLVTRLNAAMKELAKYKSKFGPLEGEGSGEGNAGT